MPEQNAKGHPAVDCTKTREGGTYVLCSTTDVVGQRGLLVR